MSNFYPRPPRGGRRSSDMLILSAIVFLSTPSARRATWTPGVSKNRSKNFYPRPPRGGRPSGCRRGNARAQISIHALREEGDAACESAEKISRKFLSTPSARRATGAGDSQKAGNGYFYPRPPRGGRRPASLCLHLQEGHFYPRPPRGGRLASSSMVCSSFLFLSTPSAKRATWTVPNPAETIFYFYPRPPRGGRPGRQGLLRLLYKFLSTPSARRATLFLRLDGISRDDFYPRPPRGGRRQPATRTVSRR